MKRLGKILFSRLDTKVKTNVGVYSKADVQEKVLNEYSKFLDTKDKMESQAKNNIMKDPTILVEYDWIDVDSNVRKNKDKLHILRNQIEVLKRCRDKVKELTNANIAFSKAFEQAIIDYINSGNDQVVELLFSKLKRIVLENKYKSFDFVNKIDNYEDVIKIGEEVEYFKLKLVNSSEWDIAHKSREIINKRKKRM